MIHGGNRPGCPLTEEVRRIQVIECPQDALDAVGKLFFIIFGNDRFKQQQPVSGLQVDGIIACFCQRLNLIDPTVFSPFSCYLFIMFMLCDFIILEMNLAVKFNNARQFPSPISCGYNEDNRADQGESINNALQRSKCHEEDITNSG